MKQLLVIILIVTIGICYPQPIRSADSSPNVAELQQQVQKLRAENEALKKENQALRKLAFEKQNSAQTTVQPATGVAPSTSVLKKPATTASTGRGQAGLAR